MQCDKGVTDLKLETSLKFSKRRDEEVAIEMRRGQLGECVK